MPNFKAILDHTLQLHIQPGRNKILPTTCLTVAYPPFLVLSSARVNWDNDMDK